MTGFQGRDPISVKSFLSGNDYLQTPKTNTQLFTAITIWRVVIFQHFSRSTRFSQFCAARISKNSKISSKISWFWKKMFTKFCFFFYPAPGEKIDENVLKFWLWSGAKVCKSCRSRKMLKDEYLGAKIGLDTEENEPSKVCRYQPTTPPTGICTALFTSYHQAHWSIPGL